MAEITPISEASETPTEWGLHYQQGEVLKDVRNPVPGHARPDDQDGEGVGVSHRGPKVAQIGTQGHSEHVLRGAKVPRGKHRARRIKRAWRIFTLKSRGRRVRQAA
jgi:hypothetical protein